MNFIQKAAYKLLRNSLDEYAKAFFSGEDVKNLENPEEVTSDIAMRYTAVFGCNRVLSETKASMPVALYRKKLNGEREPVNDLQIYDVLHNAPNEEMAPFGFNEACMTALNLGGNAVCEKLVNKMGAIVGLYPYRWEQVRIERDSSTNRLQYTIRNGAKEKTLTRDQIFHIPGPSFDGVVGMSPIEYVATAIRLGKSYESFGVQFYKNGANPSLAFKFPNVLSPGAFERLKKDIDKNFAGLINTGKPILLEEGGEAIPLTIKPADAQLIENKRFQIEDICRIYRVPLHLVQDLTMSTNNNIEHQSLEFVMYTMLPWAKRWEENITLQLLTPAERRAGYFFEYNMSGLLRGDAASRATAYATGRQWGWLSVNDIRKLENMNPIPNGDIYLQPSNMFEAGKEPTPEQQQAKTQAMAEEIIKMLKAG